MQDNNGKPGDLNKVTAENAMQALGEWPVQKFHVSHLADAKFEGNGLRPYVVYRDLGTLDATGGLVEAHINARGRPFDAEAGLKQRAVDVVHPLSGRVAMQLTGAHEEFSRQARIGQLHRGQGPHQRAGRRVVLAR